MNKNIKYNFSKTDTLCIKALAVFLMLIHHLFTFPDKLSGSADFNRIFVFDDGSNICELFGNFGKLCIAIFMFLSGYGIYMSFKNKDTKDSYSPIVLKRIKSVYIKYWQIFFVMVTLGVIIGSEKITSSVCDWVKNLLALETTFNDEWWFITMYVIVILLSPFVLKWLDRKNANPITDIIILISFNAFVNTALLSIVNNCTYLSSFNGTYFWQKGIVALIMLPMFAIGCYMAKYNIFSLIHQKLPLEISKKFIGLILLAIIFILRQRWAMRTGWGWDRLDYIYAAVFCISFSLILNRLEYVKNVLAFIGKQATGIWLIHSFFCYYYFQEFIYAPKNPILIFLLTLAVSFVLSYGISFICSYAWKKIKPLFDDYER